MADTTWQFRNVEFQSEGATLRGRLYTPRQFSQPLAAVVMAHGFSATITMTIDHYAEAICSEGFAVLLYDHRNFGISDGEPRQHINPWGQARGYRDALSYLESLNEIDSTRLATWGDSGSGAQAIVVGSIDERVKSVVTQVPAFGRTTPPTDLDGARFRRIKETLLHGDISSSVRTDGPMPVVSFDYRRHPSAFEPLTAYRWFIEYGGRLGTNWVNDVTRVQPNTPEPWNAVICAPYVKVPLLMIVSPEDEMVGSSPKLARIAFEAVQGPKEWMDIGGGHFGLLYYPSELFEQASSAQCSFLKRYLSEG
ncbi:MAG: alpha/beta hydrolase [Deltaproteobacteria bacterium]|nr:alpha/beta hydrolase [Deltaproteobacteria bacterium]